jgi:hypothetical protein
MIEITLRNGRKFRTTEAVAKVLRNRMLVADTGYKTTDANSAPKADNLDAMSTEELHALAKERGVTVHHLAGADKVRAALREAG